MNTTIIGKYKVEIYDSIDELPVDRFHKFNKYLLVDSGIGSDLNDIDVHMSKLSVYINKGDKVNAIKLLDNLRQSIYLVSQETSVRHLALIPLIKSINDKDIHDLSDENINRIHKQLNAPVGFIDSLVMRVKKKIDEELNLYFPNHFDDANVKEYYERLKKRILLQLDSIISESDHKQEISDIDDFLLTFANPRVFSGKDSTEIKYDKDFETMCLFLSSELGVEANKLTVLKFYNSFEYIKKIRKENGRKSTKI